MAIEYLKTKSYIKDTTLGFLVLKAEEPGIKLNRQILEHGLRTKCKKVIRKLLKAGVIERYNNTTKKRTELIHTIDPNTVFMTSLTTKRKKVSNGQNIGKNIIFLQ